MKLAGFCFVIVGVLLSLILFRTYGFNSNSDTYSLDGMRNSIEEMKNFESIYFYWLSMLQVSNGKDFQKISFDLISLMNKS